MNREWHRLHRMPAGAAIDARLSWHLTHEQVCDCRPMPEPLRRLDAERTRAALRAFLDGRDSRSLSQSKAAQALVEARPARVAHLAALAEHANWVVAMRALDLLEKLARVHPDWVQPHRTVFLRAGGSDQWLIRLQVVRALPLFRWTPRQRAAVLQMLQKNLKFPQPFVQAWSLDGLATFAARDASLLPVVTRTLARFERSGKASLVARARHIRARLA